jgi:hypothetical protein
MMLGLDPGTTNCQAVIPVTALAKLKGGDV